jgi:multiple sugar transport system substrate-binding protein
MKMTNANKAVLFSIIGLCLISLIYRYFPRESFQRKTTLHIDFWQEENLELQNLIAQFEEQNPDIVVVPLHHSYQDIAKKVFDPGTKLHDENAESKKKIIQSDLTMIDMDWLPNLQQNGTLESLSGFPKNNPHVNVLYETGKIDGHAFALPLFSNPVLFFYNIDILKTAGFDRPPKTREEFLRYSRALKENQIAAMSFALSADENHSGMLSDIYSWFWTSSISFFENDEAPFSSRLALETLRFLETLSKENLISPESFSKTESMKIEEFCSGKTAMMIASISSISEIANQTQFEWGISSVPTADSFIGNPLFVTENFGMGIYAQSEQKEAAWNFLTFLAGAEQNAALASSYYYLPKHQNVQPSFLENFPQLEKALSLFNAGKLINEFDEKPGVFAAEKIIHSELQKIMNGALSPEMAAEAIEGQLGKTLTE